MVRRGRHTLLLAASLLWMVAVTAQLRGALPPTAAAARPPDAGRSEGGAPSPSAKAEADLSREVPENTFLYFSFSGFAPLREPFKTTALYAIWQEPEVQTLVARPLADFKARIEAGTSNWPLLWPEVCDLLDGPAAFAVFPGTGEKAEPGGVLIAQPKDVDRFRSALLKLIESGQSGKLGRMFEQAAPAPIRAAQTGAEKAQCRANLKQLGLALAIYANDHNDNFPPALQDLFRNYVTDEALFACPAASADTAPYIYVPGLTTHAPIDAIVVFEHKGNHEGGRSVLFLDGHVEFLSEEAFNQKVAAQANAEAIRKLDGAQGAEAAPGAKAAPEATPAGAPPSPPAPYTIGSVTVTPLTSAPDSPAYCFLDGLFLLGMDKGSLETYLSWRSAAGRSPLSSAQAYTDMVAKLRPTGATLVGYLNVPGLIQALNSEMTEEDKATLTALGVDRLDWLGASLTCDPPGWRSLCFLAWHGEPTGLLGLLPQAPVPEDLLALAPRSSMMAIALNLNAAEFYDRLRALVGAVSEEAGANFDGTMAAFATQVGFDLREGLLAPLGHEFLLYAMRTPLSAFGFDVALVVRGTDETKLAPTLDLLIAYLRAQLEAQGQGKVQATDVDGHPLYSVTPAGVPIAPSFAVVPNYAVVSLFPGSARAALTAVAGGQPQAALSLSASDAFQAVRAKLATGGALLSYADVGQAFEAFYPSGVLLLTMFAQQLPFDLALLPQPQTISKHLGGSLAVVSVEPQGLRVEAYSPTVVYLGFTPVSPAVGAAMLLPALARAREEARSAVCRSNLKQVGLAMAIYANDHEDKYPPALKDLMPKYVTDEGLFRCPSDESHAPSYLYVPGLSLASEPTVMVVIERGGIHPGRRNILFADGHVDSMTEEAFQALWARQREKLNLPSLKELGDTVEEKAAVPAGNIRVVAPITKE